MESYKVLHKLGSGSFGEVRAALDSHGQEVAIKMIKAREVNEWRRVDWYDGYVPAEAAFLERLRGVRGIPELLDCFEEGSRFFLVMDRPKDAVDIDKLMCERGRFTESEARRIFRQLVSILQQVRRAGIVHRDIKLENVLVNRYTLETHLVDFGLASKVTKDPLDSFRGTMRYAPPEWLKHDSFYPDEAEVWSLGVMLYTMLAGEHLFETVADVLGKHIKPLRNSSRELRCFQRQALCRSPYLRASLNQLAVSDWLCT